ncbi:MAG: 3-phosphoglycerate dehydrogenase [Moraxellaceae bacterium]|nr:MAG: 3-phosphoglycerate dehydrogenase [Moraxellaceae bacterium]
MHKILTFNQISVKGLERFCREKYEVASEIGSPVSIMLRSQKMTPELIPETTLAIGRAGAGVNNIPVDYCTEKGIAVFNAPGANANAVKELIVCALLLCSRGIAEGMQYVDSLEGMEDEQEMHKLLEKEKKQFKGSEIAGKTLGVVGLGAIGSLVAKTALRLGMNVVGYDPALSVDAAWRLPSEVQKIENIQSLLSRSDFVTLHLPVLDATRNLINSDMVASFKPGACLLNFARPEIVDTDAIVSALDKGLLRRYATDFPEPALIKRSDVSLMPHIGASTEEAEDNCAVMVADQLIDFIENGNIKNSVNFPNMVLERTEGYRIAITNNNVPKMLGNVLAEFSNRNINVIDMLNKSRQDIAYNLLDIDVEPTVELLAAIKEIDGVISVRAL